MVTSESSTRWQICVNSKVRLAWPASPPARELAAMFGLPGVMDQTLYDDFKFTIEPGQIAAVTGPSGSGKSVLLREVARQVENVRPLRLAQIAKMDLPAIEVLRGGSANARLEMLSRCGLAEAQALITPARHLSGGQLYRLAIAEALHAASRKRRPTLVLADEFASTLDEQTAAALCRQVRKMLSAQRPGRLALMLATPRESLIESLNPDTLIVKPLGLPAEIVQRPRASTGPCAQWTIEPGNIHDYHKLSQFHYLAGPPAAHKRVYIARPVREGSAGLLGPEIAGVIVISPPVLNVRGRNIATANRYVGPDRREGLAMLNRQVECISRVIVHPCYRSCGLGVALVRHALKHRHRPQVEALAAMGQLHPLFELAGMRAYRIAPEQTAGRLLSAAQSVGLGPHDFAAVEPVRKLIARGDAAARFLQRELDICMARMIDAKRRRRLPDPLASLAPRLTRQYIYYITQD